jgi:hypothetical protein
MSECAEMARLKAARKRERRWAWFLGVRQGQPYVDAALELTRRIRNHWDGCNECQGLATVAPKPAVDESCSECKSGPGEVGQP